MSSIADAFKRTAGMVCEILSARLKSTMSGAALSGHSILAGIPGSPGTNDAARVYSTGNKLEVTGVKGTVKDKSKAGKDSFALKGTLTVGSSSTCDINPMTDGATLVFGWSSTPFFVTAPPGAGWSQTANNGYRFQSADGEDPSIDFTMGFLDLTTTTANFNLIVKRLDFPLTLDSSVGFGITIGVDSGGWYRTWKGNNSKSLYEIP